MVVYEVLIYSCYDYETSITTEIFANKLDAVLFFEDNVETARLEAEEYLHEDEREIISHDGYFNVYKDGYATDYEVEITLKEKEVK